MKKIIIASLLTAVFCIGTMGAVFVNITPTGVPTINDLSFDASRSSGLNYAYKAGNAKVFYPDGTAMVANIPAGKVAIPNNGVYYVWADVPHVKVIAIDNSYIPDNSVLLSIVWTQDGKINTINDQRAWVTNESKAVAEALDSIFNNGVYITSDTVLPPANEETRGRMFFLIGETGADQLFVCMKDAAGNYSWVLK